VAFICLSLTPAFAQTATHKILSAANAFLSTLDEKQRQTVLSSALSPRGFEKVQQIMEANEVLKTTEGNGPRPGNGNRPPFGNGGPPLQFGRGCGGNMFGKDLRVGHPKTRILASQQHFARILLWFLTEF